jgi:hypothetical protein
MPTALHLTKKIAVLNELLGGGHRIPPGTTRNTGTPPTPVRRRVRLHEQFTGRAIRETWSDSVTGAYSFDNIAAGTYYVMAFDHTGAYGGVIETDIVAEPMP